MKQEEGGMEGGRERQWTKRGLREGGLMQGTSEEGTERDMDGAREREGGEASGGWIERGWEGAFEQGREGNFTGGSIFTNNHSQTGPCP